jgi:hypothetical protein
MFRKDPESRDFAVGLSLAILVVAGFFAYAHWWAPLSSPARGQAGPDGAKRLRMDSSARADAGSTGSSTGVIASVYECNGPEGRVLSDQRCAENAQVREVLAPNVMQSERSSDQRRTAVRAESRVAKVTRSGAAPSARRDDSTCDWIEEEIDAINARMRRAYKNQEGEDFRERLRKLEDQRWTARCRLSH